MKIKKKLVIPVEFKNRELKGACALGSVFLKKGWDIYIGQKQQLFPYIKMFAPSVWYVKSIVPGENTLLKKFKQCNHFIAINDIEGLILNPHNKFGYQTRYSKENINLTDLIFFWGKEQLKEFSKVFKSQKKTYISGSQVFDSYKIFKPKKIKEKNQLLFISGFTTQNPLNKKSEEEILDYTTKNKKVGKLKNTLDGWSNQSNIMFHDFLSLLKYMKKNLKSDIKIVVRPHPAENIDFWYNFKKENSLNFEIDNSKDLANQILESKFVVHFLSTSSVLSNYLNKRTILYSQLSEKNIKKYFNIFSKKISIHYKNKIKFVNDLNSNNIKKKNSLTILNNIVNGYSSSDKLYSSNKIFKVIDANLKFKKLFEKDPFHISSFYYQLIYNLKHIIGLSIANIYLLFGLKNSTFHHLTYRGKVNKWSDTSKNEILNYFLKIDSIFFRKKNIKIKKHRNGFFKISIIK